VVKKIRALQEPIGGPEILFNLYDPLVSQLSDSPATWGIVLAHQFYSALSEDVKSGMDKPDGERKTRSYPLPNPSALTTKAAQLTALRKIRFDASEAYRDIESTTKHLKRMFGSVTGKSPPSNNPSSKVKFAHGTQFSNSHQKAASYLSPAEQVMRQHSQHASHPVNPTTGYISRYPAGFRGCLGCGEPADSPSKHVFANCPHSEKEGILDTSPK